MASIQRIRRLGLVPSPAFSHTAIVPPGATTIDVVGRNAVDADGSLVGRGDVAVQSARALDNAKTALAAAGASARRDRRGRGGAAVKLRSSPDGQGL